MIQIWDVLKNTRPKWIDGLVVYPSSKCFGWFVFILLMCIMCMLYLCALDCSYICENHVLKPQVCNINCQGQQTFRDMSMLIRFPLLVVDQRWSKIHVPFPKCDILGTCPNSCRPTKTRAILRAHRVLSGFVDFVIFWMLYDVLKVCVPAVFGEGWRCCHQSLCGRLWNVYICSKEV